MIVYHDSSVPNYILLDLSKLGVELVNMTSNEIHPSFWRFYILDCEDCERAIFRDTDSRVSKRERVAVDEWIFEDTTLHIMRDHPYHDIPFGANKLGILAGMWGMKGGSINITDRIRKFVKLQKTQQYGVDQAFLESINEEFHNQKTVHDEFFEGKKISIKREACRFIGERIDVNERLLGDDWIEIQKFMKNNRISIFHFFTEIFK